MTSLPAHDVLPPASDAAADGMAAALEALCAAGAPAREPLRWHFIGRLQARALSQPPGVQRVLEERLARAVAECRQRLEQDPAGSTGAAPARTGTPADTRTPSPLGALVQALEALAQHGPDSAAGAAPGPDRTVPTRPGAAPRELQAVRRARSTWSRLSVERQLERALAQAPQNAGPINSHRLVLRSLELMRDAAPDYLARFVAHVEALACLEQALQEGSASPAPAKARARRSRP